MVISCRNSMLFIFCIRHATSTRERQFELDSFWIIQWRIMEVRKQGRVVYWTLDDPGRINLLMYVYCNSCCWHPAIPLQKMQFLLIKKLQTVFAFADLCDGSSGSSRSSQRSLVSRSNRKVNIIDSSSRSHDSGSPPAKATPLPPGGCPLRFAGCSNPPFNASWTRRHRVKWSSRTAGRPRKCFGRAATHGETHASTQSHRSKTRRNTLTIVFS